VIIQWTGGTPNAAPVDMRAVMLSLLLVVTFSRAASADAVLEGTITDLLGKPMPNVRVHVATGKDQRLVTTDDKGHYEVAVDAGQDVSIVVGAGDQLAFRRSTVADGKRQRLDFALEIADGEIIRIIDNKPATVLPKQKLDGPRLTPPYSDQAVERDAWAKAWLFLDVSETGKVLRVKLVKRPGFDLDEIAVKEAMKLTFEPALDENGKPMRTSIFWAIEWPAHGWLVEHFGSATRMPAESSSMEIYPDAAELSIGQIRNGGRLSSSHATSRTAAKPKTLSDVRCAGTGPVNLDSIDINNVSVLRDCSTPNTRKLPYLPWLDGTQPIPPDPPEIAPAPEPPLHLSRVSYIPQITSTAATAALLAGWIYSYVEKTKYEDRVVKFHSASEQGNTPFTDPKVIVQYDSDLNHWHRWQKISTIAGMAVVGSAGITALLWFRHQRKADFSVQPENSGASVTFGGRF
jgi:carboxypeptidase family protein